MVLMSLVKSPIARILVCWEHEGTELPMPHARHHVRCWCGANWPAIGMFLKASKTPRWNVVTSLPCGKSRRNGPRCDSNR